MQERNKTVVGTYDTRDEALEVVRKLKDAGYQKENIILYANEDVTKTQSDYEAINVEADTDKETMSSRETSEDDQSLWDQIKGAFSSDTYDHDERKKDDSYNEQDDMLYPYRGDIKNGKVVVVLDGYKGEDLNKYNSAGSVSDGNRQTTQAPPVTPTEEIETGDSAENNGLNREHDTLNTADLDSDKTDENIQQNNEQRDVVTDADENADGTTTSSNTDDTISSKSSLDNYNGVRSDDPDAKVNPSSGQRDLTKGDAAADVNDPLTDGRDFSREDDDMDGYKK